MNVIQNIQNALLQRGLGAIILTSQENRQYAAGLRTSAGVVVITRKRALFMTDFRYIEVARSVCEGFEVVLRKRDETFYTHIKPVFEKEGIIKAGFEENAMTQAEYTAYTRELGIELVPAGSLMGFMRAVKDPWELECIKKAQAITDSAFESVIKVIRAGMTERELAAELVYRLLKLGSDKLAFDPIVVSGPNSALPHGTPSDKEIRPGDFITMDFGAAMNSYCSDMTRTVAVGFVTDEMRAVYDKVLEAQLAALAVCKGGMKWSDIDGTARGIICEAGYGDYFGHGLGHGLGLEIHESLDAGEDIRGVVCTGSIMTIEPGIYLEKRFGVRIEDMAYFTEDGCVNLTSSPKELMIL